MPKLLASKAHIWGTSDGCRAWPGMAAPYMEDSLPNEEREKGLAAHELAEGLLKGSITDVQSYLGKPMSNGVLVDQEMIYSVKSYHAVVTVHMKNARTYGIETSVKINDVDNVRIDFWAYYADSKTMVVIDFKYGHRVVEHIKNPTLVIYAFALSKDKSLNIAQAKLVIVQPRGFHKLGSARMWEPTFDELLQVYHDVEVARTECADPNPVCRTGSHCTTCEARHTCQALGSAAASVLEYTYANTPQNLPIGTIRLELDLLRRAYDILKQRITGLETQAEHHLLKGEPVPGLGMERKWSLEMYTLPHEDVAMMGDTFGVDIRKPLSIDTPKQAKMKGFPEELLAAMTERQPRGVKLTNVDLDQDEIQRIFGNK